MKSIASTAELYAHAIAIEREAAARYTEFSQHMLDQGNEGVASVFATLARLETEHLMALERRTAGVALPALGARGYGWLEEGPPETAARELVFRLMTPRNALAIALGAEKRAQAFFEQVLVTAPDPGLRALAREMAAEESEHIAMVERLLERVRDPFVDWQSAYEDS